MPPSSGATRKTWSEEIGRKTTLEDVIQHVDSTRHGIATNSRTSLCVNKDVRGKCDDELHLSLQSNNEQIDEHAVRP